MALMFDTLAFAQRLTEASVEQGKANAAANAVRDYVMADLVTKEDLRLALETQTLRLTLRLGTIIVGAMAALATFLHLISLA